MNWKEHLLIGFAAQTLFLLYTVRQSTWLLDLTPTQYLLFLTYFALSPLVPDLDHPRGKLHTILKTVGLALITFAATAWYLQILPQIQITAFILGIVVVLLVETLARAFEHRGVIHSIPVGVFFAATAWYFVSIETAIIAFLGFYSHLAADGCWTKLK